MTRAQHRATMYARTLDAVRSRTLAYAEEVGITPHDVAAMVWGKPALVLMYGNRTVMQALAECKRYVRELARSYRRIA